MSDKNSDYYFLRGGGEMGELIRAKDWSLTSLGDPADWPQSLRTMMAVMLDNPFGMYIAWGTEYIQLYNDGYRPILGATKHPQALGISTRETFSEIWHIIESMFDGVMNGKAVGFPDFMLPLNRYGYEEECYFDFSYSPIRKDNGEVGGVLVTVIETTEKKRATEALKESNARYINNIMQAPVAMCVFRGEKHVVEIANDLMLKLWGKSADQVINKPIFEGLQEAKGQGLEELLDNVFKTGETFVAHERPVDLPRNGKIEATYINFVYEALKETDNTTTGIVAIATDVTLQVLARKKVEESDEKLRSLIKNAPFPIGVYAGKEMRIEVANESIIRAWGKGNNVKGKLFNELMPELASQKIFEQLDGVFASGIPFHAYNQYLTLVIDGQEQPYYYNYSFTPVFDSTGKVYGVLNTASDVTDLNLIRKNLEESEQDLRSMALQAPIGICILDAPSLVCEIVNDAFIEIAGKPREAIAGRYYWDTFAEARPYYEAALHKVVTEGTPFYANEVELMLIRNGKEEIIYVTFVYAPLKDEEGNVKKVTVWVLDNTQQVVSRRKIEENTEKLNIVIDASELGTWELNLKTNEATYSNRYLEILGGYEKDIKLTHEQLLQHLHPDDFPVREKALKEAFITGHLHYESRLIWNDKSIHWMEGKGKVFYDEENNPLKLIGTIRDITEEKNHEEELKKSEEQFSTLADNMENLAWLADGEGWIYWYNKRWMEYTGLTLEEMQGWGWQKVHHPDHVDRIVEMSKKIWHTNKTFELTFPLRRYDGEYRWFLTRGYPVTNEEGKIIRWIGTNTDINEQKKAEEQFKVLADQAPMWVWLTDKEVNVLYTNPEVLKFLGIAHYTEFTGNMWEEKVHPDDISMVYRAFGEAASLQQSFSFEFRVQNAMTRQYEWFYIKAVPRLEAGEFTGFIGTGININEQKTFAKELELQVRERTKELEASNTELEKTNKELQSFAYISSHDLQEPLRKIQTFATRIKGKEADNLSAYGKDLFNRMQDAAQRMQTLIQDLLAYSRTSTTEHKFETTDLNTIIAEVKEDLKEELKAKHATIELFQICDVDIIPFQFRQLMHNLLGNSLKFSKPNHPPLIQIKCEIATGLKLTNDKLLPQKKYCHITVSDNGIGFEQQYNEKIFEVFQRLHGKGEYEGTGIGLSIVKKIVENHHGIITARGEPDKGATFDIYIPAS